MGFIELNRRLDELINSKLAEFIAETLISNLDELVELQKDQLYAGQNAIGNPLAPSYFNDPYFKSPITAAKYARFKDRLNQRSENPIFKKKEFETPNLIITGRLVYDTLVAEVSSNSLIIQARSPIISKLEAKYIEPIGLNQTAWDWFAKEILVPDLESKMQNFLQQ